MLSWSGLSRPSSVVLFDLLVNILGHNLAEPAYEAEVAQLEYKLVAGEHGLVVKVKGFNHKLHVSRPLLTFLDKNRNLQDFGG